MLQFFGSSRVIDAVLAIIVLEFALLLLIRPWRERCRLTPDLLAHLWAAASLLMSAHLLFAHHWGGYIAAALLSALLAHLVAWRLRWRMPATLRLATSASRLQSLMLR
jgi:hypothetical protein